MRSEPTRKKPPLNNQRNPGPGRGTSGVFRHYLAKRRAAALPMECPCAIPANLNRTLHPGVVEEVPPGVPGCLPPVRVLFLSPE